MKCNVCDSPLTKLIYDPQNNISLTSLCQIQGGSIRVFACTNCGHIQTNEMENLKDYYSESYTILLNSEEEDQIYKILDGQPLYRTTHQVNTLAAKIGNNFLQHNQRILDYGCAYICLMLAICTSLTGNLFYQMITGQLIKFLIIG
jgi:hypothetical protein